MKNLVLYRADNIRSFCRAWFCWLALGEEGELLPLHDGAKVPDTKDWEVYDVREFDPWDHFEMVEEPAWKCLWWAKDYVNDQEFKLPSSREVQAAIRCWPRDPKYWSTMAPRGTQDPYLQGTALLRATEARISFDDLLYPAE